MLFHFVKSEWSETFVPNNLLFVFVLLEIIVIE